MNISAKAGDIVVTNFGCYQHWALVTDQFCTQGKSMLISATKRNNTVKEETWDIVTQGKNTIVTSIPLTASLQEILQ